MKTIVYIDTNKSGSSREAIQMGEEMGYFTVLLTDRKKAVIQREEYPDVHQLILCPLDDTIKLSEEIRHLQLQGKEIKAIVSFVDPHVHTAALLHKQFCQANISTEAITIMENKELTREVLKDVPFTPMYKLVHPNSNLTSFVKDHTSYLPLIVKSPKSTGSKDVLLAKSEKQLLTSIKSLQSKYPNKSVLVEEFVEGKQFLVEAVVIDGQVHLVAIIEQEITKKERFIVTGYCVLAETSDYMRRSLKELVTTITNKLNYHNGAIHLEIRRSKGQWKLIEINPRISGGAMNKMINAAFGINLVKETLLLYLGLNPCLSRASNNYVFTQYITVHSSGLLSKVTGKNRALSHPGVVDVHIKARKGNFMSPPVSMGNRYAYVIAKGTTQEEARQRAKVAAREIQFHLLRV